MSKKTKVTILCENAIGARMGSGEHGFSAYIETPRTSYLFDTGSGLFIVDNALAFGKDLTKIERIFISHGHYDHTGGLPPVLELRGEVGVHGHPDIFLDRIFVPEKEGDRERFVGIPHKRSYLELLGAQFALNTEFLEVGGGMYLTGEVPRITPFEKPDPKTRIKVNETYTPDLFKDDQSLVLDTPQGLVIVFGCAHAGMINIIHHAMEKTGNHRIQGLIGGTHLDFLGPEQLEASIESLRDLQVSWIGVSHCTGLRAAARLSQAFGDRFRYGYVGAVFEF